MNAIDDATEFVIENPMRLKFCRRLVVIKCTICIDAALA